MSVAGPRGGAVGLSAERLSFRYPALPNQPHAPAILNDIDFALHDGQWLVVLGPTACLDPLGAEEVLDTLNSLRQGGQHALCLTTSDPELALRYADLVLLMDAGQIVLEGSPREVAQQSERLRASGVGVPQLVELA